MARTRRQRGLARLRRVRRAGCARRAAAGARGAAAVELHAPAGGGAAAGVGEARAAGGVPARVLRPLGPREAAAGGAARAKDGKDRRVEARDSMKRALPRYARINTLAHGVTWGHVRRELDRTGHVWWRPSAKEKQTVAGTTLNPEVPKGAGSNVYFRDMHVEDLLVFCPMGQSQTSDIEMFGSGTLIFQQKASLLPALALAPPPGAHVVDACAAPGSKTSQLAALMKNDGTVFALDRDKRRLDTLDRLMKQRRATCVQPRLADFLEVSPSDPKLARVTHMLLDPSCSSSGMTTEPLADEGTVAELAANQRRIIRHAMRFPSVQRIAYSTCSVYQEENEQVVASVLASEEGAAFRLASCLPWWPRRGHASCFPGAELCVRTELEDQTIGFFVALFERAAAT